MVKSRSGKQTSILGRIKHRYKSLIVQPFLKGCDTNNKPNRYIQDNQSQYDNRQSSSSTTNRFSNMAMTLESIAPNFHRYIVNQSATKAKFSTRYIGNCNKPSFFLSTVRHTMTIYLQFFVVSPINNTRIISSQSCS